MDKMKQLRVFYHERKVGTLALYNKIFLPKTDPFGDLFGVFADSLPDGWGRLLVDRLMMKNHIDPATVGSLNRLAIVGDSGMGALSYRPEMQLPAESSTLGLDQIFSGV